MNILNFMSYFISEMFLVFVYIFSYVKINKKTFEITGKNIIVLIMLTILLLVNNFYNISGLKIITTFILCVLTAKIIFKDKLKNILFTVTIYILISMIVEIVLSLAFMKCIRNIEYLNKTVFFKCLLSIIFSTINLVIFSLNKTISIINKLRNIINKYASFYLFVGILGIATIIGLYLIGRNNIIDKYFVIYEIFSLLFILLSFKIIINDKYNNKVLMENNKDLKESYKACAEVIEEYKEFKHNLKNDLFHLKANVPKENQKEINSILTKYNEGIDWVNKINCIPEGIQGIIFLKIKEAKTKNIKVYLNTVDEKIEVTSKEFLNISNIIGILLDNAMEATLKTESKIIYIDIVENNKTIKIVIMNRFKNAIDLKKIGKKNYSTKEYKSGLGLNYINKIKKNKVKVYFKIIEDLFITTVECNKKDKK